MMSLRPLVIHTQTNIDKSMYKSCNSVCNFIEYLNFFISLHFFWSVASPLNLSGMIASNLVQGKKAIIKSSELISSNIDGSPMYPPPNFFEQVNDMVCLSKVIKDVIIFCINTKLVWECFTSFSNLLEA